MRDIVTWVWCFPQNIIGFIVKVCTRAKKIGNHYEYDVNCGSVSLGNYIFLCPAHCGNDMVLRHEQGHQKQSLYLGWLYLLVIGIPSFVWAGCFKEYRKKHNISYHSFYTEAWADKIAGINRYQE
jgi:hypothetical protein